MVVGKELGPPTETLTRSDGSSVVKTKPSAGFAPKHTQKKCSGYAQAARSSPPPPPPSHLAPASCCRPFSSGSILITAAPQQFVLRAASVKQ
jgi:hypothetical protein